MKDPLQKLEDRIQLMLERCRNDIDIMLTDAVVQLRVDALRVLKFQAEQHAKGLQTAWDALSDAEKRCRPPVGEKPHRPNAKNRKATA